MRTGSPKPTSDEAHENAFRFVKSLRREELISEAQRTEIVNAIKKGQVSLAPFGFRS